MTNAGLRGHLFGGINVAHRTLTTDEIKTLYSVGYLGAGIVIVDSENEVWPIAIRLRSHVGATTYTVDPPDSVAFGWLTGFGGGPAGVLAANMTGFIDQLEDFVTYATPVVNADVDLLGTRVVSPVPGPLYAFMTSDPTDGGGPIDSAVLNDGGHDYEAGDTGTVQGGNGDATYVIDTVDPMNSNAVLTFHLAAAGTGYIADPDATTTNSGSQPGSGAALTLDIAPAPADGTIDLEILYREIPV